MSIAAPTYRTRAYWHPWVSPDRWQQPDIDEAHPDLAAAEHAGQRWGCLAGIRRVEVYSPDGILQALWDKESPEVIRTACYVDEETGETHYDTSHVSNRWQRLGEESRMLGRAEHAATLARLRADGRLP